MASPGATSLRALTMEFKALQREPVEGFVVTIPNESDFYTWQVAIFGPPDTPYQSGYFKVSCDVCVCVLVRGGGGRVATGNRYNLIGTGNVCMALWGRVH